MFYIYFVVFCSLRCIAFSVVFSVNTITDDPLYLA